MHGARTPPHPAAPHTTHRTASRRAATHRTARRALPCLATPHCTAPHCAAPHHASPQFGAICNFFGVYREQLKLEAGCTECLLRLIASPRVNEDELAAVHLKLLRPPDQRERVGPCDWREMLQHKLAERKEPLQHGAWPYSMVYGPTAWCMALQHGVWPYRMAHGLR